MAEEHTMEPTPPPAPPPPAAPKPGTALREARESRGLSLDEMVVQTKLPRSTLEAIEADDFGVLSEPVYVRGYYRKYARVVGAPEDEIIAGYEAHAGGALPKPEIPVLLPEEPIGGGRWKQVIAVIVLVAVVGGVLAWLVTGDDDNGLVDDVGYSTPAESDDGQTPSRDSADAGVFQPAAPTSSTQGQDSAASDRDATDSSGEQATGAGSSSGEGDAADGEPGVADSGTADAEASTTEPVADGTASGADDASGTTASTAEGLMLEFEAASWVRVEDASGRRVLNGLIQAGETRRLTDAAPYSVFLGYAPGVAVSYQGEAVDVSPYVRGNNTARFTVE